MSKNHCCFKLILMIIIVLFNYTNSYSQGNITFFGAGITNEFGEGSENLKAGKNFTIISLIKSSDLIYLGVKLGYNSFDLKSNVKNSSSSISTLEFVPVVRFFPLDSDVKAISGFFQAGFGIYNLSAKFGSKNSTDAFIYSQDKLGLNFGMGILLGPSNGLQLEIAPNFDIIFSDAESFKYYTIKLGILLNK